MTDCTPGPVSHVSGAEGVANLCEATPTNMDDCLATACKSVSNQYGPEVIYTATI